ncbi:MAG TPA: M12 family metallo-peptidase [Phycisphaerales bacterium]|nr:M12 family metallo-peptidase [Phycisphaerales bacterium]HRQ74534.1 M12 family metallo-peptidase [Phycisphaerales bacterium]
MSIQPIHRINLAAAISLGTCLLICSELSALQAASDRPIDLATASSPPRLTHVADNTPLAALVRGLFSVIGGTIQSLDIERAEDASVTVPVFIDGEIKHLVLEPHSLRDATFQVLVPGRNGRLQPLHPLPEPKTYRGRIAEQPEAIVAATIIGDRVTAFIALPDMTWHYIQPIADRVPGADSNQHLVYSGDDAISTPGMCGNDHAGFQNPLGQDPQPAPGAHGFGDLKEPHADHGSDGGAATNTGFAAFTAVVAFDADFPYFQANNSSVNDTINAIETVMNGVNVVYLRDTFVQHQIGTIIVRASAQADPYTTTNHEVLLSQFRTHWIAAHTDVPRHTAHLFTGRSLDGNFIGFAWIGVVCSNVNNGFGFALSEVTFSELAADRVALVAHELGHNWSAQHCNQAPNVSNPCHIMCSSIDGCAGYGAPQFGPQAKNAITSFAANASCLSASLQVRWVDMNHQGHLLGTFNFPFNQLGAAAASAPVNGHIIIKSSSGFEAVTINKALTIHTWNGTSTVGQ